LEERSKNANIECCKLERVNDLLHDIMSVVQSSDKSNSVKNSILYAKIENFEKNATEGNTSRNRAQICAAKKERTLRQKWRCPLSMVPELQNVSASSTFAK
jgi:hypothetical protein